MMLRFFGMIACTSLLVVISACGGGGGGGGGGSTPPVTSTTPTPGPSSGPTSTPTSGSSPTPVPTATPTSTVTRYVLPSASPAALSAITVDSAPHALPVTLDGTALGTTPAIATPAYSRSTHTLTIAAAGLAPYVIRLAQTANGPRSIFYNSLIDTQGKITSITSATFARSRRTMSVGRFARGAVRPISSLASRPQYSDRRFVVHYDPQQIDTARTFGQIESAHGVVRAATLYQSTHDVTRVVTVGEGTKLPSALASLARERGVTGVDRVRLRYPLAPPRGPVYPNDPFYVQGAQWYLDAIDAPDAWSYGLGKATISIAVIDTGYDAAQTEVAPGVTFSEKIVGGTIDASTGAANDSDGHGTFAAGVASAQTGNGSGYAGVAYGASLQIYKVFTDSATPTADSADVAEAIREAVAHKANLILLPLGGTSDAGPDPLERDAVAFALASNIAVIAPSGNEAATTLDYPAGYDGVISVGSSAINDSASPGSAFGGGNFEYVPTYANTGPTLGLVAPGGDLTNATDTDVIHGILNAYTTQRLAGLPACPAGTAPASCNVTLSGTSAAASVVAGASALLLAQNPTLTPAQLSQLLDSTADDIKDARQGHGRLNLHAASASLAGDLTPVPTASPPTFNAFVAFAYRNSGGLQPQIIDMNSPTGVRVNADGTFRIADIPVSAAPYKIAVWADTNGNGIIDAGDWFGVVAANCAPSGPCSGANTIIAKRVAAGFILP